MIECLPSFLEGREAFEDVVNHRELYETRFTSRVSQHGDHTPKARGGA
jgi:hypothetical protein